jgi:hypothetical protein
MYLYKTFFTLLILSVLISSCNSSDISAETRTEKRTRELSKENPVIKGRYQCWRLSSAGDEVASDIFILPNDKYQVDGVVGSYSYDLKTGSLQWLDGPFHQPSESWVGFFTAKGSATAKGGHTLGSMIEIKRQSDVDAGNEKVLIQCNCAEKE